MSEILLTIKNFFSSRDSQRGAFLSKAILASTNKKRKLETVEGKSDIENFLTAFRINPSGKFH